MTEPFLLSTTGDNTLPAGFRTIEQQTLITGTVKQKATLYNRKFRFKTIRVSTSGKPISKITG